MGSNFFRKARRIGVYACVSLPRNEENSAKKVQVPNPNSKIWLQSVPVEHQLVSNRQWFIMLVKFLNFRYASSWILCLYGSRGQISDCSIKLYWMQTVTYFYMLYIYRVRQDELDIYTICNQECPHHLVSYSIIKLESTSLARQASIKFFF